MVTAVRSVCMWRVGSELKQRDLGPCHSEVDARTGFGDDASYFEYVAILRTHETYREYRAKGKTAERHSLHYGKS